MEMLAIVLRFAMSNVAPQAASTGQSAIGPKIPDLVLTELSPAC